MAQWVEQLTCIQEIAGSNPAGEQIFFQKSMLFAYTFFLNSALLTLLLNWHSKHASKQKLSKIKHTSSGNSTMVIAK